MSTFRFYRITNPERGMDLRPDRPDLQSSVGFSKTEPIEEAEFTAIVGDRPPDGIEDVSDRLKTANMGSAVRELADRGQAVQSLGAVVVWRLDEETGKAEGWQVIPPSAG